jgi:hypothetical protein
MRRVVQALVSRGGDVPYDYRWELCHGVWTTPAEAPPATARKWIIEASASGIYAWPMRINPSPTAALLACGLDYLPIGTPRPETGVRTLATAEQVAAVYA